MYYFDFHVLIYSVINQDKKRMQLAQELINQTIFDDNFLVSRNTPLLII